MINSKLNFFVGADTQLAAKKARGFTIIEMVISIFIISVALVGIFSAFTLVSIIASDTTNRLVAVYLAQEGMEITRNMRDTNWINMDTCLPETPCTYDWLGGLKDCSTGCEADYTTGTGIAGEFPLRASLGEYLKLDNDTGFYNYTGGTPTKFKRKITVESIAGHDYVAKVTVEVSWQKKSTALSPSFEADTCNPANCTTVIGTLYDWYNHNNPLPTP